MRGSVLPSSHFNRPLPFCASYLFVVSILAACALAGEARAQQQQRRLVFPALKLQTQRRPEASEDRTRKKKGLAPLRQEEGPEGSRVTITYNTPLSDYSAYRQGDRFVVVIPKADAPRMRGNLRGRGFDGVQVERRGDDTVLSFRIRPGAKARVDQQFNRLEVVFSVPEQQTTGDTSATHPTTVAASSAASSKVSQNRPQPATSTPQTALANHNLATEASAQQDGVKPGAGGPVETASTVKQPGTSVVAAARSPAASTENRSAAPAQPPADQSATAQPAPAVSPASTSLSLFAARYWLPLLIALLLVTSAWAIIASRRRDKSSAAEPVIATDSSETETESALPSATASEDERVSKQEEEDDEILLSESSEIETARKALPGTGTNRAVEVAQPLFKEHGPTAENASSGIPGTTLRYLASEDVNERSAGVLDLADVGSDEAFNQIGAAFDDPAQQVRDAAARSLFNVSADRAASFKRIMREASPERRRRIGEAMVSSGMASEAVSDLTSESGGRAYDALLVLSLMARAGEVQSLIETIEEHPSTEVRLALVKLLALSGRQEILSTFRHLATRDSLPIAVRSSIMEAIYQLNNPQPGRDTG